MMNKIKHPLYQNTTRIQIKIFKYRYTAFENGANQEVRYTNIFLLILSNYQTFNTTCNNFEDDQIFSSGSYS